MPNNLQGKPNVMINSKCLLCCHREAGVHHGFLFCVLLMPYSLPLNHGHSLTILSLDLEVLLVGLSGKNIFFCNVFFLISRRSLLEFRKIDPRSGNL